MTPLFSSRTSSQFARCVLALLLASLAVMTGCRHSSFPNHPASYREFAYVVNEEANTVTVLDLVYLRADRTLLVGKHPAAIVANPKRNEVYVLNIQPDDPSGSISVIDTTTNQVIATIPTHHAPVSLTVDPTGHRAYIVHARSNSIAVVNLDTRRVIFSVPTGAGPAAAAIAPDGRTLVVANQTAGSVSVYATGQAASPIAARATFPGCAGAAAIAILPDSSKAFIACSAGHEVMVLNLAALPDTWAARQDANLTTDHLLALLEVGQNPTHLTLKPDGGEVFVSNTAADSISEISTTTNEVGSTYAIGDHPTAGVVSADNSALWIANAGGDSISLYSIADGKFLSSLRTGTAPSALAFSAGEHLLLAADRGSGDVAVIRTESKLGPALLTLMPAGSGPCAIVVKAMEGKP